MNIEYSTVMAVAGRCAVLHLLPFSLAELLGRHPVSLDKLGTAALRNRKPPPAGLLETLFTGFYPRIHDKQLSPHD